MKTTGAVWAQKVIGKPAWQEEKGLDFEWDLFVHAVY